MTLTESETPTIVSPAPKARRSALAHWPLVIIMLYAIFVDEGYPHLEDTEPNEKAELSSFTVIGPIGEVSRFPARREAGV